jgi:multiphosphoryl transfer protein
MVSLVIISHSHKLAEGVKEVAEQMCHGAVKIATAGGIDETTIGTDLGRILKAIEDVYEPEGVLVLMDLGSAVLTTRMALEMLPVEKQKNILLSQAPIVEGAIAAAVEAAGGNGLARVYQAACSAIDFNKVDDGPGCFENELGQQIIPEQNEIAVESRFTILNKLGIHARPAAMIVKEASKYQAAIEITNLTRHSPGVNARSIFSILKIGALQGHSVSIKAIGTDAEKAAIAVGDLIKSGFGELETNARQMH